MGLIDHEVGFDLLEHRQQIPHAVGGDDVHSLLFQCADQVLQRAAAVAGEHADGRGVLLVPPGLLIPVEVFLIGLERILLGDMEEGPPFEFLGRLRLRRVDALAVDVVADEVEHPAEVLLAAAEVLLKFVELLVGQRIERGLLAGGGGGVDGLFQLGENLLLLFGEVESHPEEDDAVVVLQLLAVFLGPFERNHLDRRIDRLIQHRGEDVFGIVHECHPGRRAVELPQGGEYGDQHRAEDGEQILPGNFSHDLIFSFRNAAAPVRLPRRFRVLIVFLFSGFHII